MNKFILSLTALAIMAVPSLSQASNEEVISCVREAVDAREDALDISWQNFSDGVAEAYAERRQALSSAYDEDTPKEVRSAVKDAWNTFKKTVKELRKELKADRKEAWKEFKDARKECRAEKDLDDSSNEKAEA